MMRRTLLLTVAALAMTAPAAEAAITIQPAQANEGDPVVFNVSRTNLLETATATTKDGSARGGSDYNALNDQPVNFGGGMSGQVTVQTLEEGDPETNETFTVELQDVGGDPIASATGTITNDDTPTLSVADVTVSESVGTAAVRVASQAISNDVSVAYATGDGTATGGDYTPSSGRATIPAGAGSTTISVPIANDTLDEENESFTITLSAPQGANIGDAQAVITITNDDARLISIGDIGVVEGDGEPTVARFPIQLSGPTYRPVTVQFGTIDGTARAPGDFLSRSGTITIPVGQTQAIVDIAIQPDDAVEQAEFFGVIIGNASGATVLKGGAVAAIRDDDAGDPGGNDRTSPRMQLTRPRLSGGRSIRARVTCPRGEQRCRGRLVLYTRLRGRERRIGAKSFSLPGNASRTLRITIPRSIQRAARGRLSVRAYLVAQDAAGNVDTAEKSARLRLRR